MKKVKKIRVCSFIVLVISTIAFIGFKAYEYFEQDKTPPVILCETPELAVSVSANEKEFLKGVTAIDEESGDVGSSLVIENISEFTEKNARVITYAAVDEAGNVGRCQRKLIYTDYADPYFEMTSSLRFPLGKEIDILEGIKAIGELDGDLTSKIKYSLESTINLTIPQTYPIEFRVMDSGGKIVYLKTELEMYDQMKESIKVNLSKYLVYLNVNDTFKPEKYYQGADQPGKLRIESNVDTKKPGVYSVDYVVESGDGIGKNRLVVVVKK